MLKEFKKVIQLETKSVDKYSCNGRSHENNDFLHASVVEETNMWSPISCDSTHSN